MPYCRLSTKVHPHHTHARTHARNTLKISKSSDSHESWEMGLHTIYMDMEMDMDWMDMVGWARAPPTLKHNHSKRRACSCCIVSDNTPPRHTQRTQSILHRATIFTHPLSIFFTLTHTLSESETHNIWSNTYIHIGISDIRLCWTISNWIESMFVNLSHWKWCIASIHSLSFIHICTASRCVTRWVWRAKHFLNIETTVPRTPCLAITCARTHWHALSLSLSF